MSLKNKMSFLRMGTLFFTEVFLVGLTYFIANDLKIKVSSKCYITVLIFGLIIWLIFLIENIYRYVFKRQREYQPFFASSHKENISAEKKLAMYPEVHKRLQSKTPKGVIFGKQRGNYVCRKLKDDGHILVIGGSGSGKSSCLVIPTLLANATTTVFAIDIKGELHRKATKKGDRHVKIFDPSDRSSYGYDPFFRLRVNSTNQEILEVMQTIVYSLIPLPADVKEPFWKLSARNMLLGLMLFYYDHSEVYFIDIMDRILGEPIKDQIDAAIEKCQADSNAYKYLVEFKNMAEATMSGIFMELATHISIFATDQDIRFAFKDNFLRLSPRDLENQDSVYISIKEEKLTAYYDVLQLIINQTLGFLETRDEDSHRILFIIDELPRILSAGKLDRLLDAARTLRSRNVILFLVTQSVEALMIAYSENEATDLISNCPYVVILSASSSKTQQMIKNWCGKYKEKKKTISDGMVKNESYSFEDKDIVSPMELMQLQLKNELILISPYGYNRLQKAPYYSDKQISLLANEVKEYNEILGG